MKVNLTSPSTHLLLLLAAALLGASLGASPAQAQTAAATAQTKNHNATFTGVVEWVPDNRDMNHYALYDLNRHSSYFLDDRNLTPGERVRVADEMTDRVQIRGTLDRANRTIYVESLNRAESIRKPKQTS